MNSLSPTTHFVLSLMNVASSRTPITYFEGKKQQIFRYLFPKFQKKKYFQAKFYDFINHFSEFECQHPKCFV